MSRFALQKWETRTEHPHVTLDDLASLFGRVGGIRRTGVAPRSLAAWALTGEGDPPLGAAVAPEARELAEARDATATTPERDDVLTALLGKIREGALDLGEGAAMIRGLFKAGLVAVVVFLVLAPRTAQAEWRHKSVFPTSKKTASRFFWIAFMLRLRLVLLELAILRELGKWSAVSAPRSRAA